MSLERCACSNISLKCHTPRRRFVLVGEVGVGTLNARLLPVAWGEPVTLLVAPESVPAGFPSPSQDYASDELDLNERLIRDRVSTFVWKAAGHSMTEAGLHDGDLLLVDRGVDRCRVTLWSRWSTGNTQ
ncbi:LexA family protein [Microbacterium amylolyticum]|uniref:LexA family protein n=1 Tax=Microbacterium amylolyticum TaxID=936337 RepID=UPI00361A305C